MSSKIYKITNLINNKIYIGKRKGDFDKNYYGSGKYLKNALNKYGKENFSIEVIDICKTLEEQNEKEKYWISYYRNNNYEMYNISKGGDGGDTYANLKIEDRQNRIDKLKQSSYFKVRTPEQDKQMRNKAWETRRKNGNDKFSDEYKKKLSESHKNQKPSRESIEKGLKTKRLKYGEHYHLTEEHKRKISEANKGKIISSETRLKMSKNAKRRIGEDNPFYGKHHNKETKKLIGSYNKDRFENTIWINNGIENKRILNIELEEYIKNGYTKGRIKWSKTK